LRVTFSRHLLNNKSQEEVSRIIIARFVPWIKKETREAKEEVREEAKEAEKGAQSVGDKISEGVNDAAATIKDEKVEGKVGPGGETVYFDDDEKYYYVNNEGDKVHITKAQLKDKPKDK
jgi:hypothetical protein